jgi:hypothetical protein
MQVVQLVTLTLPISSRKNPIGQAWQKGNDALISTSLGAPVSELNFPTGHATHSSSLLRPVEVENVPRGHGVHGVLFVSVVVETHWLPRGQSSEVEQERTISSALTIEMHVFMNG